MNTNQTIEIKFTGHGEYGIHDGFFNAIAVINGKEYDFQCCADENQTVDFDDCGYDWGLCEEANSQIAEVIGWPELLELLKRAYKEYNES